MKVTVDISPEYKDPYAVIHTDIFGSDHCPVSVEMDF